ncbi:MAG: hypothetical protein ACOY0T_16445 [Myxococcota bacterium]
MSTLRDKDARVAARSSMDHARFVSNAPRKPSSSWLFALGLGLSLSGCGFGGRVDLGENGGQLGLLGNAAGGHTSGSDAKGGAVSNSAGTGGAPASPQGGTATMHGAGLGGGSTFGPLPMDETGLIPISSNGYGIEGKWFAFSDELDGGQTRIQGYEESMVPFVAGRGMCIEGTTQSGFADNWKTWGAGIAFTLNWEADQAQPLKTPPPCFTIVISADAVYPAELRADLSPTSPPEGQPLNVPLHPGTNEVCLRDAQMFQYCTPELTCLGLDSLEQGLGQVNIVAPSGWQPGPIAFCIESVTPHD